MNMLKGIDVSGWQEYSPAHGDFVIIKASEGVGYKSDGLDRHYDSYHGSNDGNPDNNLLYGFYHYARPDLGNSAEDEADWFVSLVGHHAGHAIFALDWEAGALDYPAEWALRWLNRVKEKTGVKALFYCSASVENSGKYNALRDNDYGLWVADYRGRGTPEVKHWPFWAFWQFTSTPIDQNYFNGGVNQFRAYCNNGTPTPTKIEVGDFVKVETAIDYNGVENASWVLNATFSVMQINGDRVVIGRNGHITGAWHMSDLYKM